MRILQVVTRRQRRGAEVFATELADALVARSHAVLVAALYEPPELPLTPEHADWLDLGSSSGSSLDPWIVLRLARAIHVFRPDVVQANGSDTLKYTVLARLLLRGRWPLVYRNISIASRWLRSPAHRHWNRWLVKRVDRVVAVSRASAEDFMRTYGVEPERLTVLPRSARMPEAVDRGEARRVLAAVAAVPMEAPILMHVGSFSAEKNHLWLLDVFERVRHRYPDTHLVLVGDGPLRTAVEERVRELGSGDHVHLMGVRADAAELLAAADIFVLPSLVEGLPGVVLEAAGRRVPTVANGVGGVHQAIRHEETGMLVPPEDPQKFLEAVAALLEDPTQRRMMGERARNFVKHNFDFDETVERYQHVYAALLERNGADTVGEYL